MDKKGLLMVVTLLSIVAVFIPSLVYWLIAKNSLEDGFKGFLVGLLNFEITLALILFILGFISGPFAGFVGSFIMFINLIFVIIATLNLANDKSYKFPFSIPLFK